MRIFRCLIVALLMFALTPCLPWPGGGEVEQKWLDRVIAHLETRRDCQDPHIREAINLTIERYHTIGHFGVKVMQLPEGIDGINNVLCPGITVDCAILTEDVKLGALVLVHETMHDMPPYIGHSHIDNQQILRSL